MLVLLAAWLQLQLWGRAGALSLQGWGRSQRLAATLSEPPLTPETVLLDGAGPAEFSSSIKTLASRRRTLSAGTKAELVRRLLSLLPELSHEQVCDCVWAAGTLSVGVRELSEAQRKQLLGALDRDCLDPRQLLKSFSGLSKMGIRWDDVPESRRAEFLDTFLSSNGRELAARETATLVYTLGQLGCDKERMLEGQISALLRRCEAGCAEFNGQGAANVFHGLSKIGFVWQDLPQSLREALMGCSLSLLSEMKPVEVSSLFNSLALMRARWGEQSSVWRTTAAESIRRSLSRFDAREVSNAVWFLGKLDADFESLPEDVRLDLFEALRREAGRLTSFDLESLLVGLGLMQVPMRSLDEGLRGRLFLGVRRHLDELNIHGLSNVLWGLARTGVSNYDLDPPLATALLDKAVLLLHTFLPAQYGDILWSLGSIGYRADDMTSLTRDRILAVVSRVFGKLNVRAAAYALWGLGKMRFSWKDMLVRTRSLAGGREAPPLAESVSGFLRRRVSAMKEHEFAVLLYALGLLEAEWGGLQAPVREKLEHRMTRVGGFLTPRSASNALLGLSRSRAKWSTLAEEAREAWMLALERTLLDTSAFELAQTLYALGILGVKLGEMRPALRGLLIRVTDERVAQMSDHGVSTGAYGLALLGCEWTALTPSIQRRIFQIFDRNDFAGSSEIMSLSFAARAITLFKAELGLDERGILQSALNKVVAMNSADLAAVADILDRLPAAVNCAESAIKGNGETQQQSASSPFLDDEQSYS